MERQLPAGLSDTQRSVLSEFFAGRVSAGQLTQRLGIEAPAAPAIRRLSASSRVQVADLELPRGRAAGIATALRRRLTTRRLGSRRVLSLTPERTEQEA